MVKQLFKFALISISTSLVGAQEEQKVEEVKLPADHTAAHALHGIIDNNLPPEVVQLIGKFMGGYTKINILKPERPFFSHRPLNIKEQVNSLSFAPDGIHIASASEDEAITRIWHSDTGKCIQSGFPGKPNSTHWSKNGLVATAGTAGCGILLPFTATYLYFLPRYSDCKWSPSGIRLAACLTSSVHICTESDRRLEVPEGQIKYLECSKTLEHEGQVRSISWLSDTELITTCNNKIIKWNPNTAECLTVFEDPDGIVYTAQGSPKGNFIASYGKTVRILEAKSGKLLEVIPKTCLPLHWLSEDLIAITLEQDNPALSDLDEWSPNSDSVTRFNDPTSVRIAERYATMEKRRIGVFNRPSKEYDVLGGEYSLESDAKMNRVNVWAVHENGAFTSIDSSQAGRIVAGCSEGKISVWDPASKYLVELCDPEMREQLRTPAARAIKALQKIPGIKTLTEACVIQ